MRSKYLLIVASVLMATGAAVWVVYAGNPGTTPGPPETTSSYTLEAIYNRLDTGEAGTQITFTEPISGPMVGTGHTLDEIMSVAPSVDDINGATQMQVLTGRTAWGLTSAGWGLMTGTMADNGAVTLVPTTTNQTIAVGYHNGSGYVAGDTALVPGNIVSGATIFDVSGSAVEASGNAAAADVLTGKTFSNDSGAGLSGTMPDNGAEVITPATINQTIAVGYHNGSGYVEGDADLAASNIISDVIIFGVTGSYPLAPVPKTGQTKCYTTANSYEEDCPEDTGTYPGQDGDWQKGVTWPNPRFTDNGDGTVTDNLTSLIWLKNANCPAATRNWSIALSDVTQLNTDGKMNTNDCGDTSKGGSHQTDWRLPNVREMQSLVHYGFYNPAVPNTAGTGQWSAGNPFTGVISNYYWSSTSNVGNTDYALYVTLSNGFVSSQIKTNNNYVWPVRAGQ